MAPSSISVLVVDDFEPFRQFLSSSLQKASDDIVCWEASDGLEAVHKAEELQPDLILLDIGLPKLNGMEAARKIAKASPRSKILFVSQESSAEVVQEAFRLGAWGYIVKTDAARELLAAVNVVLRGARFAGSRFDGHDFNGASDGRFPESARPKKESARRHEVQFYSSDEGFLENFAGSLIRLSGPEMRSLFSPQSHTGTAFYSDCRHGTWMSPPPLSRVDISRWMLPALSRH
jgi:DNA-binding NarL/FixJ family response regulator